MRLLLVFTLLLKISFVNAQVPSTDIYLYEISAKKDGIQLLNPKNITNRPGYDNQPFFFKGNIFFTSMVGSQTDIYQYDIKKGRIEQLTNTPESEYSATVMPGNEYFSVIRVEKDSSQRLWKFPLKGGTAELVLKSIKPVGYHAYLNDKQIALFVLGEPNTLQLANIDAEIADTITQNIGRSFHKIPKQESVSFVQKSTDGWTVKAVDGTGNITDIAPTLLNKEDLCWLPDGRLLMGNGPKLFLLDPNKTKEWIEVADLQKDGIKMFSRIAVSADGKYIAIVATE